MRLVSINAARPQPIAVGTRQVETGIFKRPVVQAAIRCGGIVGDSICNGEHHGGPDQAVYVYTCDDYRWFEHDRGSAFAPGTFGENLTIDGLESAAVGIGDRVVIGDVILEASAPRIPCSVFGARVGDRNFPAVFRRAERPGFYCRVVRGGHLRANAHATIRAYAGHRVTIAEMFRAAYEALPAVDLLRRHLAAPISARERLRKERQLAKHGAWADGAGE